MAKDTKIGIGDPEPLEDQDSAETLADQLRFLRGLQAAAERTMNSSPNISPTFLREARDISRTIAGVITAQSKLEKHEQDRVEAMAPEERNQMICEYIKETDSDARDMFRATLAELKDEGGLLS